MSQEDLEAYDKVQPGKYTLGLGQRNMAFTGDQEDVVSMSLTAVHSLLEKYEVNPCDIGRCRGLFTQLPGAGVCNMCVSAVVKGRQPLMQANVLLPLSCVPCTG